MDMHRVANIWVPDVYTPRWGGKRQHSASVAARSYKQVCFAWSVYCFVFLIFVLFLFTMAPKGSANVLWSGYVHKKAELCLMEKM